MNRKLSIPNCVWLVVSYQQSTAFHFACKRRVITSSTKFIYFPSNLKPDSTSVVCLFVLNVADGSVWCDVLFHSFILDVSLLFFVNAFASLCASVSEIDKMTQQFKANVVFWWGWSKSSTSATTLGGTCFISNCNGSILWGVLWVC